MSIADPAEVATGLRALLASVDAGEVEGGTSEVAYLTGAADALEMVTEMEPDSLRIRPVASRPLPQAPPRL